MKREEISQQCYIDWLKSMECVFYCIFDGVNGTKDLINNTPLVLTGYGSCTYDPQYDMYKLLTPSSSGYMIGIWNNGINNTMFTDDNYTVLYTVRKIPNSSSKFFIGISCVTDASVSDDYDIEQAPQPSWNGTGRTNSFPSGLCNFACVCNHTSGNRSDYQNGV